MADTENDTTTIQVTNRQKVDIDEAQPDGMTKGEFVHKCVQAYANGETIEETRVVPVEEVKAEVETSIRRAIDPARSL